MGGRVPTGLPGGRREPGIEPLEAFFGGVDLRLKRLPVGADADIRSLTDWSAICTMAARQP